LIEQALVPRLLVIRAVDDEASLILAFGTIVNYLTAMTIRILLLLFLLISGIIIIRYLNVHPNFFKVSRDDFDVYVAGTHHVIEIFMVLTISLFGLLTASRSVHGRELAVSPMECQINTQSTPDAKGLSEIITLVRRTYVKSLRHGIYDHEDCAKTISDWVRSQLPPSSALPASQHVGPNAF